MVFIIITSHRRVEVVVRNHSVYEPLACLFSDDQHSLIISYNQGGGVEKQSLILKTHSVRLLQNEAIQCEFQLSHTLCACTQLTFAMG